MPPSPLPKGRLISHFEDRPTTTHGKAWSDLWDLGESDLWDRGIPSPALIDLIEGHQMLFTSFRHTYTPLGGSEEVRKRKKALVPGCGRGYDVVSLALHGFDAYGLEISSAAVAEAREYAANELTAPQPCNFGKAYENENEPPAASDRGEVQFLEGDFFSADWLEGAEVDGDGDKFDLIYDYTFLCALHPSRRKQWAERMVELLRPGGLLVCLEFPMYKDPTLPGPPWGVRGVLWELLAGGEEGNETGVFRRRLYYKPERTYKVGEGTDMISVYARMGGGELKVI
ncbi:S-adenosyl-L-methionine-dependent methyltransferase [Aspergillus undulatus]|uniref:S-adenosyl-L-methionine-dependent methyltransferase n=1 Tax=Aspergillus undulatus TaxID=1810928 RepID=UPI003CCD3F5A